MSFWLRVKQSQLRGLSNQLKRCYFSQFHGGPSAVSSTKSMAFANPHPFLSNTHFQSCNPVRFFAVPAQVIISCYHSLHVCVCVCAQS